MQDWNKSKTNDLFIQIISGLGQTASEQLEEISKTSSSF